jgi:hypothetical protein
MDVAMGAVMEEKMKWTAQVELLEVLPEVHHARLGMELLEEDLKKLF